MATIVLVSMRSMAYDIHDKLTQPVVDPKVRHDIPHSQIRHSIILADEEKNTEGNGKTQITQENELGILGLIQWTRWVEMVDATPGPVFLALATAFRLALVVVVPSDVERDIQKPSGELLSDHMASSIDGSFFHQLRQLVRVVTISRGIHFAGLGHENHVTLDVTGRFVVFAMRDLPRKVWNQQGGMADPAHGVVQHLRWGERLMSTFVRQHPQTSPE